MRFSEDLISRLIIVLIIVFALTIGIIDSFTEKDILFNFILPGILVFVVLLLLLFGIVELIKTFVMLGKELREVKK